MKLPIQIERIALRTRPHWRPAFAALGALALNFGAALTPAHASELVTLKNGFDMVCDHRESVGDRIRLYLSPGANNFVEFGAAEIASFELQPEPALARLKSAGQAAVRIAAEPKTTLTQPELHEMLAKAGAQHNLDVDLLASVVHAESGGRVRAVSRTGARGLMQLMPGTAAELGVEDSFRPEENIRGGVAYLDSLLGMYRDNLALALAAYNAGPAAVARWHGVPPYRETRAYVARVIREFNREFSARQTNARHPRASSTSTAALVTGAATAEAVTAGAQNSVQTIASR